ncbi:MAG: UDP-N-acetylmuramoylalanine--D-glutamate ligase, partial [Candidatus Staskawiczbacteria bacterium RIFOXYA2_FULL_32_7]
MEKKFKAINFEFTSYEFKPENGRVIFNYKTEFENKEPILWTETIVLPSALGLLDLKDIPKNQLEKILQSLHIILGISYYKFYCATNIKLPYQLNKNESAFWKAIYKNGLGEFFYRNNLNLKISSKFAYTNVIPNLIGNPESNIQTLDSRFRENDKNGYLIGVSGGKDSIVGAELLKKSGENITAFYIETNKESELVNNVIKLTELPNLRIKRILDSKVFEKHQYNGHIPISAIYAFLGMLTCILYKYDGFVVSNEYSSNFGNTKYKGLEINHQWSKTFEFEKMFSDYIKENISESLLYFSILRPFYEIRIAEMFNKYPKYFQVFSSCNSNFKIKNKNKNLWCGRCAKCVFTFTILSPFIEKKDLIKIFNKNLYQDKNLLPLFKDVFRFGKIKPFDCVGTFQEAQTALKIAEKNYKTDFIVRQLSKKSKIYTEVFSTQGESASGGKTQSQNLIPEKFKFLGMKSALILGYGKEGIVTKKYLHKFYPKLKIGIADEKIDRKNYLKKQKGWDIAIKTPGIKKELTEISYTTATNIFLANVIENNTIIGITGSKGKSTTSTLIYEILKSAGKDVEFLGNIGKPMLEYLLENKNVKSKIFVLELSSYQLDDIKFSPHIAVITNLFPEHLNYHGNLKNYYSAKKNIINFQTQNDYFIYNAKNKILNSWLKNYKGKAIPFTKSNLKSNLLGEHNKSNIASAVEVAKILNISDEIITKVVLNFKGLEHRLEFIGEFKGIKFYDDAISTTPESTIMAIKSVPNIGTIFLGGQDRGYNFTQLEKIMKKYKIKNIVLFPNSGKRILKSTKGLNILNTKQISEAVKFAYKHTAKGSVCLLSCASPSYSLWKNFEEKGNQFKKFV